MIIYEIMRLMGSDIWNRLGNMFSTASTPTDVTEEIMAQRNLRLGNNLASSDEDSEIRGATRDVQNRYLREMAAFTEGTRDQRRWQLRHRLSQGGVSDDNIRVMDSRIQDAIGASIRSGMDSGAEASRLSAMGRDASTLALAFQSSIGVQDRLRRGLPGVGHFTTDSNPLYNRDRAVDHSRGPQQYDDAGLGERRALSLLMGNASIAAVQPPTSNPVEAGSGYTGGGTVTVNETLTIPLTVDGREIARAVGTHTLNVDQRHGARVEPGARRRVLETGVQ